MVHPSSAMQWKMMSKCQPSQLLSTSYKIKIMRLPLKNVINEGRAVTVMKSDKRGGEMAAVIIKMQPLAQ